VFRACGGYESWAPLRAFPGRIPVPTGRERCGWAGPAAGKTSLPMAGRGGFLREAGSLGRERGQGKGGKKADLGACGGGGGFWKRLKRGRVKVLGFSRLSVNPCSTKSRREVNDRCGVTDRINNHPKAGIKNENKITRTYRLCVSWSLEVLLYSYRIIVQGQTAGSVSSVSAL
jgi:hypothetical protein